MQTARYPCDRLYNQDRRETACALGRGYRL